MLALRERIGIDLELASGRILSRPAAYAETVEAQLEFGCG
jgi:hypothetical protein